MGLILGRMTMVADGAVGMLYPPVWQMDMIMVMLVNGKRCRCRRPEKSQIFGVGDNIVRASTATDMAVEA